MISPPQMMLFRLFTYQNTTHFLGWKKPTFHNVKWTSRLLSFSWLKMIAFWVYIRFFKTQFCHLQVFYTIPIWIFMCKNNFNLVKINSHHLSKHKNFLNFMGSSRKQHEHDRPCASIFLLLKINGFVFMFILFFKLKSFPSRFVYIFIILNSTLTVENSGVSIISKLIS